MTFQFLATTDPNSQRFLYKSRYSSRTVVTPLNLKIFTNFSIFQTLGFEKFPRNDYFFKIIPNFTTIFYISEIPKPKCKTLAMARRINPNARFF